MKREINPSSHVSHFTFHRFTFHRFTFHRFTFHWAALLLYALLTALMTWPLALHLPSAIPGDSFDGWQNFWNLWWVKLALVDRQTTPFVTDLLYAPTGVGLYFHTLNPFNGLVTLPVQLTGGLYLAYNAVVFLSWVLGGYGVFLLTLWVLRRRKSWQVSENLSALAAFVAGLIFTFAPFHMAHLLGHMQVMSLEWMPFYILYLLRATRHATPDRWAESNVSRFTFSLSAHLSGVKKSVRLPWLRDSLLAGLFLVLVGLCDWYFVLYLFLFTVFYLLVYVGYWMFRRRSESLLRNTQYAIRSLLPASLAGLVFLLLLSPILAPMISEALRFRFMERPASDLYILSAAVADFFVPNRLHTLFRPESFTWPGNQIAPVSERTIAIGYTALLLVGMAVAWARRRSAFWLAVAALFFLLALGPAVRLGTITAADIPAVDPGPTGTLYGLLVEAVPFMRISRSVSRFAVMVQLALAVAAGAGLYELLKRVKRPRLWVSLAGLLVLAEFWVAPFPISPPDTPDFYRQLAADPAPGAVLNLPMNYDRPGYLLYQTVHQKPLTVAYISRDDPRTLTERAPVLQHFRHLGPDVLAVDPVALGPTVLDDLGVGWVVADRYKMPGGTEREYTDALAEAIFADQPPVYADERITAWRVTRPDGPQPYLMLGALGWGPFVEEDGRAGRWIGEEAAGLLFRHASGLEMRVTIRYRTVPGASGSVLLPSLADRTLAALPPAPTGGEVTLDFAQLLSRMQISTPVDAIPAIALSGSLPQSIFIESIRLETGAAASN